MRKGTKVILLRLALVAGLLAVWQLLALQAVADGNNNFEVYFSSPIAILQALLDNRALLLSDTGMTLSEAFLGFCIGVVTGVITAILFAQFEIVDLVVEPIFQALNSIPRPALAPLLIIWFGLGMVSKVTVAWSVVFFIMFYNVHAGVKSIDPDYVKSIRLLGASSRQIIGIVIVPAIVSWVFAALRICVAYSLLGAIVGEFAGATSGLGYRLIVAEGLLQTDLLYAIILILMLVGYVLAATTKRIESRLLRWRPPVTAI
jgi:NitT/TauT family transport system permease protein